MHQIGLSYSLRGRTGAYLNSDHGTMGGLNRPAGVAPARLCSNVSSYCVKPTIGNAYGLRAVTLGRLPPPGRCALASNAAGRRGVDSSVSSVVTGHFILNGDSMMPVPRVEARALPVRAIGLGASAGLLYSRRLTLAWQSF